MNKAASPFTALLATALAISLANAADYEAILDALGEYSPRGAAAQESIYSFSTNEMHELLIRGLKRERPETRIAVIRAVGDKKALDLLPLVVTAGKQDGDWRVKDIAMITAKELNPESSASFLREELSDDNPLVVARAIRYLESLGYKEDIGLFRGFLSHPNDAIRLAAADALIQRGIPVDRAIIIPFISISSSPYRGDAVRLLGEVGNEEDRSTLESIMKDRSAGSHTRIAARVALGGIRLRQLSAPEKVQFLATKLSDPHEDDSLWAAYKLLESAEGVAILNAVAGNRSHPGHDHASHALKISASASWIRSHSK